MALRLSARAPRETKAADVTEYATSLRTLGSLDDAGGPLGLQGDGWVAIADRGSPRVSEASPEDF
jgi:hypothetical protein